MEHTTSKTSPVVIYIAIALIAGTGGFYAGKSYSKSNIVATNETQNVFRGNGGSMTSGRTGDGGNRRGMFGSGIIGTVLKKDGSTLTISLRDGGSRIVLYSSSTPVMNTVHATTNDVQIGSIVMVNGTSGTDGSLNAATIQIRPDMPSSTSTRS